MKNSRIILIPFFMLMVFLLLVLTAANPWKSRLRIINLTGKDIFLVLSDENGPVYSQLRIPGEPTPPPTPIPTEGPKPTPGGTLKPTPTAFDLTQYRTDNTTMFTIERKVYYARLIACGVVMDGTMDLTHNLHLTITSCLDMVKYDTPKYLGEPMFEKPNFFRVPGMANWRFRYFLPEVDMEVFPNGEDVIPIN